MRRSNDDKGSQEGSRAVIGRITGTGTYKKKMKIPISALYLMLILSVSRSGAQDSGNAEKGISFAVESGLNLQNFYGNNSSGESLEYNLTAGFNIGFTAIKRIVGDLCFETGLFFTTRGASQEILEDVTRKYKLTYLEIPAGFLYRPVVGEGHLLLGIGPYIAFGVSGEQNDGEYGTLPARFMKNADLSEPGYVYFKPFDAGAGIYSGYELNSGLYFQMNALLGTLKINSWYIDDKASKKNIGFGFSGGYRF
jgi:hypothetical protein